MKLDKMIVGLVGYSGAETLHLRRKLVEKIATENGRRYPRQLVNS